MKTIWFWDIDGVLSIPTPEKADQYELFALGLPAWPIPLAYPLLQRVDQDQRFRPVWLSSWNRHSQIWNERAGTRLWPVGYGLTSRQMCDAKRILPAALFSPGKSIDRKFIAVRYYLRRYPATSPVLWIEDGFTTESEEWATERGNVQLIDTTKEPLLSALLAEHLNQEASSLQLVEILIK